MADFTETGIYFPIKKLNLLYKNGRFRIHQDKIHSEICNLLHFGAIGRKGILNLANLPFEAFWSQSNTNSNSTKSTVFIIGTDQTHPYCNDEYSGRYCTTLGKCEKVFCVCTVTAFDIR